MKVQVLAVLYCTVLYCVLYSRTRRLGDVCRARDRGGDGNWTQARMINFNFNEILFLVGMNVSMKGIANVSSRRGNCEKSVIWFIEEILPQSGAPVVRLVKILFQFMFLLRRNHKNSELNPKLFQDIWLTCIIFPLPPLSQPRSCPPALEISSLFMSPALYLREPGFYQQIMEFIEKSWGAGRKFPLKLKVQFAYNHRQ